MLKETDGWSLEKQANGITMHSKPMNNLSIGCYRIIDDGVVAGKDAKKMVENWVGRGRRSNLSNLSPKLTTFFIDFVVAFIS